MPTTVEDVMTRSPVTCPASASLADAARIMRECDIGDVLVEEDGHVRGIVTDRDIVVRGIARQPDASKVSVIDVCSSDLLTVRPDSNLEDAIRLMRDHAVRRIPVVDGAMTVGVLSLGDVAVERDPTSALADISAAEPND